MRAFGDLQFSNSASDLTSQFSPGPNDLSFQSSPLNFRDSDLDLESIQNDMDPMMLGLDSNEDLLLPFLIPLCHRPPLFEVIPMLA